MTSTTEPATQDVDDGWDDEGGRAEQQWTAEEERDAELRQDAIDEARWEAEEHDRA